MVWVMGYSAADLVRLTEIISGMGLCLASVATMESSARRPCVNWRTAWRRTSRRCWSGYLARLDDPLAMLSRFAASLRSASFCIR